MVLIVMFALILALSVVFMYAAIHPDGLVVFSKKTTLITSPPAKNESLPKSADGSGPPAVVFIDDPWWIHLVNDTYDFARRRNDEDPHAPDFDWDRRVRVKMVNEPATQPPLTLNPTSTTKTPKRHPSTTQRPTNPPDYDEQSIIYNYKSYESSGRPIKDRHSN